MDDIETMANFVGGSRGGEHVDYAAAGSCRIWLSGGPWPTSGVVDLFMLMHFIDHMLVMLVFRDFYGPVSRH